MNNTYGQIQQSGGNQLEIYNQINLNPYNYNANNQSDFYPQSSYNANFNVNNQEPQFYPTLQSGTFHYPSAPNMSSNTNKNSNIDPLSELFG